MHKTQEARGTRRPHEAIILYWTRWCEYVVISTSHAQKGRTWHLQVTYIAWLVAFHAWKVVEPRPKQCGRFPGIIPVFDLFLINFEWYWYWYLKVVFELFDCFSQLSL